MRHYNSVFHDLLKRLPWASFERLVAAHSADKHVRRLSTKDQFVALLYGQFSGASSLREIVGGLASHSARLYHVGARGAQRWPTPMHDGQAQCFAVCFPRWLARHSAVFDARSAMRPI